MEISEVLLHGCMKERERPSSSCHLLELNGILVLVLYNLQKREKIHAYCQRAHNVEVCGISDASLGLRLSAHGDPVTVIQLN